MVDTPKYPWLNDAFRISREINPDQPKQSYDEYWGGALRALGTGGNPTQGFANMAQWSNQNQAQRAQIQQALMQTRNNDYYRFGALLKPPDEILYPDGSKKGSGSGDEKPGVIKQRKAWGDVVDAKGKVLYPMGTTFEAGDAYVRSLYEMNPKNRVNIRESSPPDLSNNLVAQADAAGDIIIRKLKAGRQPTEQEFSSFFSQVAEFDGDPIPVIRKNDEGKDVEFELVPNAPLMNFVAALNNDELARKLIGEERWETLPEANWNQDLFPEPVVNTGQGPTIENAQALEAEREVEMQQLPGLTTPPYEHNRGVVPSWEEDMVAEEPGVPYENRRQYGQTPVPNEVAPGVPEGGVTGLMQTPLPRRRPKKQGWFDYILGNPQPQEPFEIWPADRDVGSRTATQRVPIDAVPANPWLVDPFGVFGQQEEPTMAQELANVITEEASPSTYGGPFPRRRPERSRATTNPWDDMGWTTADWKEDIPGAGLSRNPYETGRYRGEPELGWTDDSLARDPRVQTLPPELSWTDDALARDPRVQNNSFLQPELGWTDDSLARDPRMQSTRPELGWTDDSLARDPRYQASLEYGPPRRGGARPPVGTTLEYGPPRRVGQRPAVRNASDPALWEELYGTPDEPEAVPIESQNPRGGPQSHIVPEENVSWEEDVPTPEQGVMGSVIDQINNTGGPIDITAPPVNVDDAERRRWQVESGQGRQDFPYGEEFSAAAEEDELDQAIAKAQNTAPSFISSAAASEAMAQAQPSNDNPATGTVTAEEIPDWQPAPNRGFSLVHGKDGETYGYQGDKKLGKYKGPVEVDLSSEEKKLIRDARTLIPNLNTAFEGFFPHASFRPWIKNDWDGLGRWEGLGEFNRWTTARGSTPFLRSEFLGGDEAHNAVRAMDNILEAYLRIKSGAAVPAEELAKYILSYMPTWEDSAETAADKMQKLDTYFRLTLFGMVNGNANLPAHPPMYEDTKGSIAPEYDVYEQVGTDSQGRPIYQSVGKAAYNGFRHEDLGGWNHETGVRQTADGEDYMHGSNESFEDITGDDIVEFLREKGRL